jgi:tetratricopeptide (TPR) repeat protein
MESYISRAIEVVESADENHKLLPVCLAGLAHAKAKRGHLEEALPVAKRALALQQKRLGPDHLDVADSWSSVGMIYGNLGELDASNEAHKRTCEIRRARLGDIHERVAECTENLGANQENAGHFATALHLYREALDIREQALGPDHGAVGETLVTIGAAQARRGRFEAALDDYDRALPIVEKAYGSDSLPAAYVRMRIGETCVASHRAADAIPLLESALATYRALDESDPAHVAATEFLLAQALWSRRSERERALELAASAKTHFAASDNDYVETEMDLERWLAKNRR